MRSFWYMLLVLVTLAVVTLQQTHYLFVAHAKVHEHCDSHWHGAKEQDAHCEVCKFDILVLFHEYSAAVMAQLPFSFGKLSLSYKGVLLQTAPDAVYLRGPPVLT